MKMNVGALLGLLSRNRGIEIVESGENLSGQFSTINGKEHDSLQLVYKGTSDGLAIFINNDKHPKNNQFSIKTSLSKNAFESLVFKMCNEEMAIYSNFLDMIHSNTSLDELMDYINKYVHNPIILYDRSFHVLSYTRKDIIQHHYWKDVVDAGGIEELNEEVPSKFVTFAQSVETYVEPTRFSVSELLSPFILCNVVYKGKLIGSLCMAEYHFQSSELERVRLKNFADLLTFELQKSLAIPADSLAEQFLIDLLSSKNISRTMLASKMRSLSFKQRKYYVLIGISVTLDDYTICSIKHKMHNTYKELQSCIYDNLLVFLCPSEDMEVSKPMNDLLEDIAEEYQAKVVISDFFMDIFTCGNYYKQLVTTLQFSKQSVCMYKDIAMNSFMNILSAELSEQDIVPLKLQQIRIYDEENHSEYYRTLQVFLENYQHQSKTADKLHIHRSTLLYRLDKMQELFKVDYNDAKMMYIFLVGMQYLEYR